MSLRGITTPPSLGLNMEGGGGIGWTQENKRLHRSILVGMKYAALNTDQSYPLHQIINDIPILCITECNNTYSISYTIC